MVISEKIKADSSYIKRYAWILVAAWSIIVFTLLFWDAIRINDKTLEYAYIDADTAFKKDILYRQWSTMHGGVYVPITNITQPNPYLSDIPERDILTPSGKLLTLINPAYMTRQAFELEREVSDTYSHITSLKPIRPENAADMWEIKALIAFENGEKEVSSIETINGTEYFRLMRPLIATKGCLNCHATQGYKENDIRGGISISLPMDSIRELSGTTLRNDILIYIILWLVGISGITFGYFQISKSESKRNQAEDLLKNSKEFAETIINRMNEATAVIDVNNARIIDVNSVFQENYGMKKEEVLGKTCYEVIHKSDKPCTPNICPLIETLKTGKPSTIDHLHYSKNGEKRYSEVSTSPIFDENKNVINVIHSVKDITERKKAQEALNQNKALLSIVFNNISDMVALLEVEPDLRMRAVSINKSYIEKVRFLRKDFSENDIIGQDRNIFLSKLFGPEFDSTAFEADTRRYQQAIETRKPLNFEQTIEMFGKKLYLEVTIVPVFNDAGICRYALWSGHDITERKIAEQNVKKSLSEKEVLLREIHHRVKNNMQIISSLLNLQMGYIKDKNIIDIFSESQNRILSMALVHEKLYQSSDLRNIDFKEYINNLGSNLLQTYNANNIKLNVNVEEIQLDIDIAIPAGLIINELITNSLKYAFPDGMKGEITISLFSIGENMLKLVVSDNGVGLPKDLDLKNTKTLGLNLVTSLAESQLHGKIDIYRDKGTEFHIEFKGSK